MCLPERWKQNVKGVWWGQDEYYAVKLGLLSIIYPSLFLAKIWMIRKNSFIYTCTPQSSVWRGGLFVMINVWLRFKWRVINITQGFVTRLVILARFISSYRVKNTENGWSICSLVNFVLVFIAYLHVLQKTSLYKPELWCHCNFIQPWVLTLLPQTLTKHGRTLQYIRAKFSCLYTTTDVDSHGLACFHPPFKFNFLWHMPLNTICTTLPFWQ